LAYKRGGLPAGIYDGYMNAVFTFPFEGHIMWTDLIGDGQSQVIIYSDDEAVIYSAEKIDLTKARVPYTRPQPKRLYNWTRYWGSEMDPKQYAVNYITGDFTNVDIIAWAKGYIKDKDKKMNRADFIVLTVNVLKLAAYERNNFKDVLARDYFADAAGIAKKLGIVSGDVLNPKEIISVDEAAEIISRASGKKITSEKSGELTKGIAAELILKAV